MSGLSRLNALARNNRPSVRRAAESTPTVPSTPTADPTSFVHSNNIIMMRGLQKGMKGVVTEFRPAMYDVEVNVRRQVVLQKVQSVVSNRFFPNVITLISEPHLTIAFSKSYGAIAVLRQSGGKCTVQELKYMKRTSTFTDKIEMITHDHVEEPETMPSVRSLQQIAQIFTHPWFTENDMKENNKQEYEVLLLGNTFEDRCSNILPERYVLITEGKNKGFIGVPTRETENKKEIIQVAKAFVDETKKIIRKGMFKNQPIQKIIQKHQPSLKIRIDLQNTETTKLSEVIGSSIITRDITPNDVFYMDAVLTNDNFFSVRRINQAPQSTARTVDGIERVVAADKTISFVQRTVSMNDIKNFLPGFSFGKNNTHERREESRFIAGTAPDNDTSDDEHEPDSDSDSDSSPDRGEERELVSGQQDIGRTEVAPELTTNQRHIKNKLTSIANQLRIPLDYEYYFILQVEEILDHLKKMRPTNTTIDLDTMLIIAVLFLRRAIRDGYSDLISVDPKKRVQEYIRKLMIGETFKTVDIPSSFFSSNTLLGTFENAARFVDNYSHKMSLTSDLKISKKDLIPLKSTTRPTFKPKPLTDYFKNSYLIQGEKESDDLFNKRTQKSAIDRMRDDAQIDYTNELMDKQRENDLSTSRLANIYQIIHNQIPPRTRQLYWPPDYEAILAKIINKLKKERDSRQDTLGKEIYDFVITNIRNAPIVIRDFQKKSDSRLNRIKFNALKSSYVKALSYLKGLYNKKLKDQKNKVSKLIQEKADSLALRERRHREKQERLEREKAAKLEQQRLERKAKEQTETKKKNTEPTVTLTDENDEETEDDDLKPKRKGKKKSNNFFQKFNGSTNKKDDNDDEPKPMRIYEVPSK